MGNCLKTQLKEVVNNDNLVKLGEIRLRLNVGSRNTTFIGTKMSIVSDDDAVFRLSDGSATREIVGSAVNFKVESATVDSCVVSIKDKYNLSRLSVSLASPININSFAFSDNLEVLNIGGEGLYGVCSDRMYNKTSLTQLVVEKGGFSVDIIELLKLPAIGGINIPGATYSSSTKIEEILPEVLLDRPTINDVSWICDANRPRIELGSVNNGVVATFTSSNGSTTVVVKSSSLTTLVTGVYNGSDWSYTYPT